MTTSSPKRCSRSVVTTNPSAPKARSRLGPADGIPRVRRDRRKARSRWSARACRGSDRALDPRRACGTRTGAPWRGPYPADTAITPARPPRSPSASAHGPVSGKSHSGQQGPAASLPYTFSSKPATRPYRDCHWGCAWLDLITAPSTGRGDRRARQYFILLWRGRRFFEVRRLPAAGADGVERRTLSSRSGCRAKSRYRVPPIDRLLNVAHQRARARYSLEISRWTASPEQRINPQRADDHHPSSDGNATIVPTWRRRHPGERGPGSSNNLPNDLFFQSPPERLSHTSPARRSPARTERRDEHACARARRRSSVTRRGRAAAGGSDPRVSAPVELHSAVPGPQSSPVDDYRMRPRSAGACTACSRRTSHARGDSRAYLPKRSSFRAPASHRRQQASSPRRRQNFWSSRRKNLVNIPSVSPRS